MVVANLLLDPADSYVLPHTRVHYTVHQLKQGHLEAINLKASRFFLQVRSGGRERETDRENQIDSDSTQYHKTPYPFILLFSYTGCRH